MADRRAPCLALLSLLILPGAAFAQDDPGKLLFNNACRTCHTLDPGDNRLGPTLHAVVGRKAGSLPDYPYSPAMKGSPLVWDEASLDRFIENPDAAVPGHNMKPYAGIAAPEERASIIAYLKANAGAASGAAPQ